MLNWTYIEIEYKNDDGTEDTVHLYRNDLERIKNDAEKLMKNMSGIKNVLDDVQKTVELADKLRSVKLT